VGRIGGLETLIMIINFIILIGIPGALIYVLYRLMRGQQEILKKLKGLDERFRDGGPS